MRKAKSLTSTLPQSANEPPYLNIDKDVAHEEDYESEDMDVQPDNPGLQHFKKQGPLAVWLVVGNLFIIYMWWEYIYQHYPDDENFRKPLPPPLDHPNPSTTPDTRQWNFSKTETYRYLVDSGHVKPISFRIENGKKIYNRFAGVNKPMEFI